MRKLGNNRTHREQKNINGCITVTQQECQGNVDKMIRKFIKKVKNDGIIEEYRSRTHFTKPSDVRREERRNVQRTIQKVNKQREELFRPRDAFSKRSNRRK
tara:strand:+ start:8348 stop:8650 length:303 start_codon:yes stop_codon:yes gene_type:complete